MRPSNRWLISLYCLTITTFHSIFCYWISSAEKNVQLIPSNCFDFQSTQARFSINLDWIWTPCIADQISFNQAGPRLLSGFDLFWILEQQDLINRLKVSIRSRGPIMLSMRLIDGFRPVVTSIKEKVKWSSVFTFKLDTRWRHPVKSVYRHRLAEPGGLALDNAPNSGAMCIMLFGSNRSVLTTVVVISKSTCILDS